MAQEPEICQVFDSLSLKFSCLLYERSEKQYQSINSILNEFNNLNFKLPIVTNNNKAVLLIHQLCTVVPPSNIELVQKCCTLIVNLIVNQSVIVERRTLLFAVEWSIEALKTDQSRVCILKCLQSLIRDHVETLQELLPNLIGKNGILVKLSKNKFIQDEHFWAIKCLEAVTYKNDEQNASSVIVNDYLETCAHIFLDLVTEEKQKDWDEIIYCKLIISCLRGLQSIILQNSNIASNDLGIYLGVSKCYMTYFLCDSTWVKPLKIMPSNLSVADLRTDITREKRGGKVTKQRKQRKSTTHKKDDVKRNENTNTENANRADYKPATIIAENSTVVISDSDFSDSENGKSNKISLFQGRVRQAALNILLSTIKVTDKHVMFGYWSSFFPDGSPAGIYSLNQCLLKEPSPRGRIAILNVITTILNGSKLYLSQAESSIFQAICAHMPTGSICVSLSRRSNNEMSAIDIDSIVIKILALELLDLLPNNDNEIYSNFYPNSVTCIAHEQ